MLHYNTHDLICQLFFMNSNFIVEYSFIKLNFDGSDLSVRTFRFLQQHKKVNELNKINPNPITV